MKTRSVASGSQRGLEDLMEDMKDTFQDMAQVLHQNQKDADNQRGPPMDGDQFGISWCLHWADLKNCQSSPLT